MKDNTNPLRGPNKSKSKDLTAKQPVKEKALEKDFESNSSADKLESVLLQYLNSVKMVIKMKELSAVIGVSHSRVTHIMDGLVQKKLVSRRPSEEDRRCWVVEITALGKELAEANPDNVNI